MRKYLITAAVISCFVLASCNLFRTPEQRTAAAEERQMEQEAREQAKADELEAKLIKEWQEGCRPRPRECAGTLIVFKGDATIRVVSLSETRPFIGHPVYDQEGRELGASQSYRFFTFDEIDRRADGLGRGMDIFQEIVLPTEEGRYKEVAAEFIESL